MRIFNISLTLSAVILTGYLFTILRQPYQPKMPAPELTNIGLPAAIAQGTADFKGEVFKRKNLFNTSAKKTAGAQREAFVLLGVSTGDKNLAMIRDTAANKDYYCKEGDKIGAFMVREIFKDKVVLESDGNLLVVSQ